MPKNIWLDNIDDWDKLLYRLCLSINIDYASLIDENTSITLWEIEQRCYFYGQKITTDKVDFRDAIISAFTFIHADPKAKEAPNDLFKIHQLSIAYQHERPFSDYAKNLRKQAKEKRKNVNTFTAKT